jgi:hypothetical protein
VLRGDEIAGKAMRRCDVHAINHPIIERVRPVRRKLPILVGGADRGGGDDLLAKRLGDRVGTAVRRQFLEYILPMKPNGVDGDIEDDADFFVGLAFRAPG